jgi:hypothetical protein
MLIVDSQIHLWQNGKMSAHHRQIPTYSVDDALAEMASAGVDCAVIHPPSALGEAVNVLAVEAVRRYPDKFCILGHFDLQSPDREQIVARWRERPGTIQALRRAARTTSGSRPSHQLDSRTVCPTGSQRGITGDERSRQRFGQRKIGGVIGRHVIAQLPDPGQEKLVGIADERKIDEILEGLHSTLNGHLTRPRISTQHLSDLEVEKVRRVKRLTCREESRGDSGSVGRVEENLQHGGRIDHDHRLSRSALTALAVGTRVTTGARWASRCRSSASVGRSATRRTSWRR